MSEDKAQEIVDNLKLILNELKSLDIDRTVWTSTTE